MNSETKLRADIPAHVPLERVIDFDLFNDYRYREAGSLHAGLIMLGDQHGQRVHWTPHNGGHWLVNDYELIFAASRNPDVFSNSRMTLPRLPEELEPRLIPLNLDPPEHTAFRLPLMRAFSPTSVAALESHIRALAIDLIETMKPLGRADFCHAIAEPLPVIIFMRLMGMDESRLEQFRAWTMDMLSKEDHVRANAFVNTRAMFDELIDLRQQQPADDVVSRLLAHQIDGRALTREELLDFGLLLFVAGLDTVANSLALGMGHLAGDPALQARLRDNPELVPEAVEELLRAYGVAIVVRHIKQDTVLDGVQLKAGEQLMLLLPAGNYDPKVFPSPEKVDLDRENKLHITFNSGVHRCVGSHLARLELKIFYEEWFRRMPEVVPDPAEKAIFRPGLTLGYEKLPLMWSPPAPS